MTSCCESCSMGGPCEGDCPLHEWHETVAGVTPAQAPAPGQGAPAPLPLGTPGTVPPRPGILASTTPSFEARPTSTYGTLRPPMPGILGQSSPFGQVDWARHYGALASAPSFEQVWGQGSNVNPYGQVQGQNPYDPYGQMQYGPYGTSMYGAYDQYLQGQDPFGYGGYPGAYGGVSYGGYPDPSGGNPYGYVYSSGGKVASTLEDPDPTKLALIPDLRGVIGVYGAPLALYSAGAVNESGDSAETDMTENVMVRAVEKMIVNPYGAFLSLFGGLANKLSAAQELTRRGREKEIPVDGSPIRRDTNVRIKRVAKRLVDEEE